MAGRSRRSFPQAKTARTDGSIFYKAASRDELMSPVHVVAKAIKGAGKPFEALAHDIKVGVLHLKDLFDPLKDCAEAAAHFLWAELTANEENSKIYQGELAKSDCDAAGWSECLSPTWAIRPFYKHQSIGPTRAV